MSDDKDYGFAAGEHNSGEYVSEADKAQPGISGWQGGVQDQSETDGEAVDEDEPAVE
ncbi:hypothetical protein ACFFGH_26255 [Lysobacter korlensis]|uniref:Uncharacterized protein n=1 Tax=Lysobacter korlensis TaxID=553636 RepID=A0ABV6RWI1_9GAMM